MYCGTAWRVREKPVPNSVAERFATAVAARCKTNWKVS
jgi:hypothetical protein